MKIDRQNIKLPQHPTIIRYSCNGNDTLSLFFIGGVFQHYILEDEFRKVKVAGETRIPANKYPIKLRTAGGHHTEYLTRYGAYFHKGMVEICQVPNFKNILYHCGNNEFDTDGCILTGDKVNNNQVDSGCLTKSRVAYERTYPKLINYIYNTRESIIEIFDMDRTDG